MCCIHPALAQNYIQTLEASLQEEMSRHAPLYGAGLEALSLSELETLARIHDEGLRSVRLLQQQRGGGAGELLVVNMDSMAGHSLLPPPVGMYASPPPMAVGMPSILANGMSVHGNGHMNGSIGSWYPPPWFIMTFWFSSGASAPLAMNGNKWKKNHDISLKDCVGACSSSFAMCFLEGIGESLCFFLCENF